MCGSRDTFGGTYRARGILIITSVREKVIALLCDNDQLHSEMESRTTTHLGKIHYYHCSKNRDTIIIPFSGIQVFEDVNDLKDHVFAFFVFEYL